MENRRKKPSHNQDTSTSSTITAVRGLTGQEDPEIKSKQCSGGVEVVPEKLPGAKQFKVTRHEADNSRCQLGPVSGWRSTIILTAVIRKFVSETGLRGPNGSGSVYLNTERSSRDGGEGTLNLQVHGCIQP